MKDLSILVVEDIEDMRHLLKLVLEEIPGMQVSGLAQNTWEARIEVGRRRPDLVLLDEILPGESSSDLLKDLVDHQIPALMITELDNAPHPVPSGALGRIHKPGWNSIESERLRIEKAIREALRSSDQGS